MTDLKPIAALNGDGAAVDTIATLTIRENPDLALASVAARQRQAETVAARLNDALSLPLPATAQWTSAGDFAAIWRGPDQWMINAEYGAHALLASELKAVVGDAGSVTEQTDGWCCFDAEGEKLVAAFERLCALDFAQMQAGKANRTSIHHLGCLVVRTEAGASVFGPRSSARSLHHALVEAAHSVA